MPSTLRPGRVAALAVILAAAALWAITAAHPAADAAQTSASGLFRCQQPNREWTEIASGPNSFAIGNCRSYSKGRKGLPDDPGTPFTRVRHSTEIATAKGWEIGEIGGSFDGCGVVKRNESRAVKKSVTTKNCLREPSQPRGSFVANTDCAPGRHCTWDRKAHGDYDTQLTNAAGCMAYANVRPFSDHPGAKDPVGMVTPQTQKRFPFWRRYVTIPKDPAPGSLEPNVRSWALGYLGKPGQRNAQSSGAPASWPQWVFVDAACVTSKHPLQGIGKDRPGV